MIRKMLKRAVAAALISVAAAGTISAEEIPTIRFGRQTAAEDNLWLMLARAELAPNLGKTYKVEWSQWRASDMAFKAYEGGQVDLATTAANAVIAAAAKGLDFKIIASVTRESERGAKAQFLAKSDGPATIAGLKGTTIGIVGYRSSIELWARAALRSQNLDPDRDVKWVVVPFPAMADAIRAGKISTGGIPEMFAMNEMKKGDLKVLFTSKTGVPFDEELIVILANPAFLKKHPAAVRAFVSDLVVVTKYYEANLKEARQAILDAKLTILPPAIYLNMADNVRAPNLRPSIEILNRMQDNMLALGFQDKRIDMNALVDLSFVDGK